MKRLTIRALITILITLLTLEGLLRLFDPWRVIQYTTDSRVLYELFVSQPDGSYKMLPGVHTFRNWTATIGADGYRIVPDTHPAACTIALVGDSVTFGFGDNDADVWGNLLARDFPAVHILNLGMTGYNADQVLATIQNNHADGYFYLMIWNDAEPPLHLVGYEERTANLSAMAQYVLWFRATEPPSDVEHFSEVMAKIQALNDVQVVGFQTKRTGIYDWMQAHYGTPLVPLYTHPNSHADPHPNAEGNQEIEMQIKPYFDALIGKVCH